MTTEITEDFVLALRLAVEEKYITIDEAVKIFRRYSGTVRKSKSKK